MTISLIFKLSIGVLLITIVYNLFKALWHMSRSGFVSTNPQTDNVEIDYLGKRIMFCIIAMVLLLVAVEFGWIQLNPPPR